MPSEAEPTLRFFVNECLGRHVVSDALRAAGEHVVQLPPATPDEVWLPRAGAEGWLCLTKDHRLLVRPNEVAALREARTRIFAIGGKLKGEENAARFVAALSIMKRAAAAPRPAFFARIEENGDLSVRFADGVRLEKPRRFKAKPAERRE